jgi:hypothetical protein
MTIAKEMRTPDFYALLIGIDCYFPNKLPGNLYYRNLDGCVRDVLHMEGFLKKRLGLSDKNILKLTATNTGVAEPSEPPEQWPTYENIVGAFRRLIEEGRPGDHIYIHYSGHGGRSPTLLPELKGENGLDESLVPTDIGNPDSQYLRDIEIAKLLKAMVDKELVVTVVLDSCHSGGATRGARTTVRGLNVVDTTARPLTSLVGSREELAETWRALTNGGKRNTALGSGWLPEPQGYVLLAACRPSESAYEYAFNGEECNGALTYWLLDSLQTISPGLTYKNIHDRIVAKIHSQFEGQTPQLQGEGDRVVFGSARVRPQYATTVLQVDKSLRRVLLATGQAQGVGEGSQFAVYERGATDLTRPGTRVAVARISALGATESWAKYEMLGDTPIEQGANAVLIDPGMVKLIRKVRLLKSGHTPSMVEQEKRLDAIKNAIAGSGWVEIASDDEPANYQVSINEKGEYQILNQLDTPVGGLWPVIHSDADDAASRVALRLVHLARYHATLQLDNHDLLSPLAGKLVIELVGKQKVYDPADKPQPEPFDSVASAPTIAVGEWTFLRIKNKSSRILNIVVLDLQPDWGISQLYPAGQDWFMSFDPDQEETIPLRASLPDGHEAGTDVIKVIAAIGSANFHWLELPPLDRPPTRRRTRGEAQDPLARFIGEIAAEKPSARNLTPAAYPDKEWVTSQVEICITRHRARAN